MKASELRDELTKLIEKHGDLPVFNYDGSRDIISVEFYDECAGDCDCTFNMEVNWCEEDHFIDGFVITES